MHTGLGIMPNWRNSNMSMPQLSSEHLTGLLHVTIIGTKKAATGYLRTRLITLCPATNSNFFEVSNCNELEVEV
ncbi:hypothetical protein TNCV_4732231 [Trichonephila clavipes]|nr:hypothetical protein TNCV_4732231 [Trichonephila clavipes]